MTFAPGENVGPYRVIAQLGQGGMASVFKAYHPALDRFVAIKVLHPAFKEEPNFLSRFQREARVVAKLEHPNIVPVYDFAEHKGQPYLVMKYIEGETLKARLSRGPLSRQEALKIVEAVGNALAYAHDRGVLHRDVKPSNILLSPDGSIYLADFGLARIAEAGASTLSKDVMLGTPQYISPEQAKGNIELHEGTDIYSFGVVLYELVVGRVPFNADTPFSIIHDHIYTPLPLPRKVNPKVPEVIERVLLRSLAKDPLDRFHTVDSLVQAFRTALNEDRLPQEVETVAGEAALVDDEYPGGGGEGLPAGAGEKDSGRVPPKTRSRRWPWIAIGLGSTLVCLFVFLLALGAVNQETPTASEGSGDRSSSGGEPIEDPSAEGQDRPVEALTDPGVAYKRAEQLSASGRQVLAAQGFIRAADLFLQQDAFIEAANSYLRAFDLDRASFDDQDDLVAGLTQAAFLGATTQQIWPVIERIGAEASGWPPLWVIEARANLFVGDSDQTIPLLEAALRDEGDSPLARAVWAEYELMYGDAAVAREMLQELMSEQDRMPPWLNDHIRNLMKAARQD